MRRVLAASALLALAAGALTGCSGNGLNNSTGHDDSGDSDTKVTVESVDGNWFTSDMANGVGYIYGSNDSVEGLELVLGGSGSQACAPEIETAEIEKTTLEVTLVAPDPATICTADFRPYNFLLKFTGAERIEKVTVLSGAEPNQNAETFLKKDFVTTKG